VRNGKALERRRTVNRRGEVAQEVEHAIDLVYQSKYVQPSTCPTTRVRVLDMLVLRDSIGETAEVRISRDSGTS
jgi:hypothetical protein